MTTQKKLVQPFLLTDHYLGRVTPGIMASLPTVTSVVPPDQLAKHIGLQGIVFNTVQYRFEHKGELIYLVAHNCGPLHNVDPVNMMKVLRQGLPVITFDDISELMKPDDFDLFHVADIRGKSQPSGRYAVFAREGKDKGRFDAPYVGRYEFSTNDRMLMLCGGEDSREVVRATAFDRLCYTGLRAERLRSGDQIVGVSPVQLRLVKNAIEGDSDLHITDTDPLFCATTYFSQTGFNAKSPVSPPPVAPGSVGIYSVLSPHEVN